MSVNSYNQYTKLSDSLERELMREALSCGEPVSIVDLAKSFARGLKKILSAFVQLADDTAKVLDQSRVHRSEEHTSELQSLMRISYAVFCLKKKTKKQASKTR